jgi:hypothetical protein
MGWDKPIKTWNGQTVEAKEGSLVELRAELHEFMLKPFGTNEDLQQVVRRPSLNDARSIPVGVVSLNYQLIQHSQVLDWLQGGLEIAGLSEQFCSSELFLSHYGERMLLWTSLYNMDFDPGDGHPVKVVLVCQNSVDKSCALEIYLMRLRLVCSNALLMGASRRISRMHVQQNERRMDISKDVAELIAGAAVEQAAFSQWLNTPVTLIQVDRWVDSAVAAQWTDQDAARVAAICRSGWDGEVKRAKDTPPSGLPVGMMEQVSGACAPVNNVYHAAQALSWIASQETALEARFQKVKEIPTLLEKLAANR